MSFFLLFIFFLLTLSLSFSKRISFSIGGAGGMSLSKGMSLSFSVVALATSSIASNLILQPIFCEFAVSENEMQPISCVKEVYSPEMQPGFCVLFCRKTSSVVSNLISVTVLLPPDSSVQVAQNPLSMDCLMRGHTNRSAPSKRVSSPVSAYLAAARKSLPISASV